MTNTFAELQEKAQTGWDAILKADTTQIFVGTATCGRAAGGLQVIDALRQALSDSSLNAEIYEVGCNGLCFAEVLVDIIKAGRPRISYRNVTPDIARQLIEDYLVNDNPRTDLAMSVIGEGSVDSVPTFSDLPEMKSQVRVAMRNCGLISPFDIDHYLANGGYAGLHRCLTELTPEEVLEELKKSGLRGRGGAAFPTSLKWSFIANAPGPVKYHLCNAEEGDPGAYNDKTLLESDPLTVIEGMTIGGYATAASKGYIFIRCLHFDVIKRVQSALDQAREYGLLGGNILGTDFSFDIVISQTGESYVSGEETALMESIEGKRAMPRYRPPFPAQVGLWGKPSNINNVKTYAYVPEILAKGGDWYAGIGTEKSKGTALVCLTGNIEKPQLVEVPFGLTLRQVIDDIAGGVSPGKEIKLLQTGGPLGGFLGASKLDVALDFDEMAAAGAILGSGGIIVGDESSCAVEMAKVLADFNNEESCGKCFPCRLGAKHILEALERMTRGEANDGDVEKLLGLSGTLLTSLCGHGQLSVNPIRSAVNFFKEELDAHILDKRCPAGRCRDLVGQGSPPASAA